MLRSHVAWLLSAVEEEPELRGDLEAAAAELADREP